MIQNYTFRARNKENLIVTGNIQSVDVESAKKILIQNHLAPLSITSPKKLLDYIPIFGKVGIKEKSLFARQLATMIQAGLTISQSLRLLIKQTKKGTMKRVLEIILNDLEDGFGLSTAMAKFPDVFDTVFINVVRSGEATGKLEMVLAQLATNIEKDVKVRSKIKGVMMYPAFIIMAMLGVAVLMMTQVIPQLRDMFTSSSMSLPISTKLLIAMSDFMVHSWYYLIIGILVLVVGLRYLLSTPFGVKYYGLAVLKIPVVNMIIEQSNMARFGRLMGLLLSSGVPLLEALHLLTDAMTNREYRLAMADVAHQVERGVPMSKSINENPVFPPMVAQMIAVGEQTGKMDEIMTRTADYYESEVDSKINGLSGLIEPVVIILLGVGVAFLVVSILLPIYQISTSV